MKNIILKFTHLTNRVKNNKLYKLLLQFAKIIGLVKLFHNYRSKLKEVKFKMNILGANVTMIDRTPNFYYYYICLNDKAYEPALTRKINELITKTENPLFIDIGAHLGYYTLLSAAWNKGKQPVYAFEPNPDFFSTLKESISINKLTHKIKPFQIALSDKEGKAKMTGWDSRVMDEDESGSVKTLTFDQFCEKENIKPDIMKIDVHGAEGKILNGMSKTLTQVSHVFCETHSEIMDFCVNDIVQMMVVAGLKVYEFTDPRNSEGVKIIPLNQIVFSDHKDRIIYGIRE